MVHIRSIARLAAVIAIALTMSACQTLKNGRQLEAGPGLEFDAAELEVHRKSQDEVLTELMKLTALPGAQPAPPAPLWDDVIAAGMNYADGKCDAYMHALFRLNRDRRTSTAEIGLLGTATAGIMAAAKSAAKDVAIVAIAFGLASSTVDNLSSNLLYDLDPSSVRAMVQTMQTRYRSGLGKGYSSRPAAVTAIRRYAVLCLPASIEAEVNLSVKKAEPDVGKADPAKGIPPTVTNATTSAAEGSFEFDDSSALLTNFVFPGGVLNATNRRKLEGFLQSKDMNDISVVSFINTGVFAQERTRAVKFFGLSN